MNPGFSAGESQNPKLHVTSMNSATSGKPAQVSNKGALSHNETPSGIPTVSFDLGNEWDDWDDFDDENLVHASETLVCAPAKSQVQQSVKNNMPGDL